jgi:hypothetical protein
MMKRYRNALNSISQKNKQKKEKSNIEVAVDQIAGSLPDEEKIEVPEVL